MGLPTGVELKTAEPVKAEEAAVPVTAAAAVPAPAAVEELKPAVAPEEPPAAAATGPANPDAADATEVATRLGPGKL